MNTYDICFLIYYVAATAFCARVIYNDTGKLTLEGLFASLASGWAVAPFVMLFKKEIVIFRRKKP